jgi:hypothetical protein
VAAPPTTRATPGSGELVGDRKLQHQWPAVEEDLQQHAATMVAEEVDNGSKMVVPL